MLIYSQERVYLSARRKPPLVLPAAVRDPSFAYGLRSSGSESVKSLLVDQAAAWEDEAATAAAAATCKGKGHLRELDLRLHVFGAAKQDKAQRPYKGCASDGERACEGFD